MVLTVLTGGFGLASKREERKREMSRSMETMDAWGSGAELVWSCYHMHGVTELRSPLRLWLEMSLLLAKFNIFVVFALADSRPDLKVRREWEMVRGA